MALNNNKLQQHFKRESFCNIFIAFSCSQLNSLENDLIFLYSLRMKWYHQKSHSPIDNIFYWTLFVKYFIAVVIVVELAPTEWPGDVNHWSTAPQLSSLLSPPPDYWGQSRLMLVSHWSDSHQHGSLIGWEDVCSQGQGLPSSAKACRSQPVFPQENHLEKMFRDKIWNCDGWGHENWSSHFWQTDTSGSLGVRKWEIIQMISRLWTSAQ